MSGGSRAPEPDKNIGRAAMMSARTGQEYLNYMREIGDVSMAWAEEDRERFKTVFQPIEDRLVAEAMSWDTPERRASRGQQAEADVIAGAAGARQAEQRRNAAFGIAPDSGRALSLSRNNTLREGLARAGARNTASRQVEAEGSQKMLQAAALGKGLEVNPGASLGMAGNLTGAGFEGAMQGYNQQGQLLNTQYRNQLAAWDAQQQNSAGLWGGIGQMAGMFLGPQIFSSKDYKTDRSPPSQSPLDQVNEMPVQEFRYREGIADGGEGRHIGPMAEDFQAATGRGNGRTISVQDAIGTTMGAVQELSAKVDALTRGMGRTIGAAA